MASMSILTASQVSDSIWHTILSRIKIRTIRKVNKKDYFHKNQKGRFIFYIFFKAVHTIFLFFLVFESGQDFFLLVWKLKKCSQIDPFLKVNIGNHVSIGSWMICLPINCQRPAKICFGNFANGAREFTTRWVSITTTVSKDPEPVFTIWGLEHKQSI